LKDAGDLVLRGREVVLRPLRVEDAAVLTEAGSESRESYGYNPVPGSLDEATAYIARAMRQKAAGQRIPFAIVWRDRVVGSTSYSDFQPWEWPAGCGFQRVDRPDALEIGYTWLAASAQRTGCNTEAKYLLLRQAFDAWEVHRVSFRTDERNERSRRAIERLGARFEGIRRADMPGRDCTVRNSAYYSIVSGEWPAIRSRMESVERTEGPPPLPGRGARS
jgi:RimJ/RimL family protein N-acetyltransferase